MSTSHTEDGQRALVQAVSGDMAGALRAFSQSLAPIIPQTIDAALRAAEPHLAAISAALSQITNPFDKAKLHTAALRLNECASRGDMRGVAQVGEAIRALCEQAAAKTELQGGAMEARGQALRQMLDQIHRYDRAAEQERDWLRQHGYGDNQYEAQRKKLLEEQSHLQPGTKGWCDVQRQIDGLDRQYGVKVEDKGRAEGNETVVHHGAALVKTADDRDARLARMQGDIESAPLLPPPHKNKIVVADAPDGPSTPSTAGISQTGGIPGGRGGR